MSFFGEIGKAFKKVKKVVAKVAPIAGTIAGAAIGGPAGASMGGSMGGMLGGMLGSGGGSAPEVVSSVPAVPTIPTYGSGVTVGRDGVVNFPGSAPIPPFVNPTLDYINREKFDSRGNSNHNSGSNVTPLLLGLGALLLLND